MKKSSFIIFLFLACLFSACNKEITKVEGIETPGNNNTGLLDDFKSTITLNGKTFKDCFVFNNVLATSAYSEIYFNSEVGVVAYRGIKNELWVFEEFTD